MIPLLLCQILQTHGRISAINLKFLVGVENLLKKLRLEEASFSPIPDEQNDEIDEPLSSDQFSQLRFQNRFFRISFFVTVNYLISSKAFHKAFDTKDIDTFPVNSEQASKLHEKRSSPRTDLDTIEIERVTEEEAEALKMRSVKPFLRSIS